MVVSSGDAPEAEVAAGGPAVRGVGGELLGEDPKTTFCSALGRSVGSGAVPVFSAWTPRWSSRVASPPSSRIMLGAVTRVGPVAQSRSGGCTTSTPPASRPSRRRPGRPGVVDGAVRADDRDRGGVVLGREDVARGPAHLGAEAAEGVSMRTAVWIVMCSEPAIRAPASWRRAWRTRPSRGRASRARRAGSRCGELSRGEVGDLESMNPPGPVAMEGTGRVCQDFPVNPRRTRDRSTAGSGRRPWRPGRTPGLRGGVHQPLDAVVDDLLEGGAPDR